MSARWIQFVKEALHLEAPLHPLDHRIARKYVKDRLVVVYPSLKNDPQALEEAYRVLDLEPRRGVGKDEAPTVFEMKLPE